MLVLFAGIVDERLQKNVDLHGLRRVEYATVGLDTVALWCCCFYLEGDALLCWVAYCERNGDVVVEGALKAELVGRVEQQAAQWVDQDCAT